MAQLWNQARAKHNRVTPTSRPMSKSVIGVRHPGDPVACKLCGFIECTENCKSNRASRQPDPPMSTELRRGIQGAIHLMMRGYTVQLASLQFSIRDIEAGLVAATVLYRVVGVKGWNRSCVMKLSAFLSSYEHARFDVVE